MEKRSFIPFDAETFLMIEDVTGTEPEVTEKENYFELKMYAPDKEQYSLLNTKKGREICQMSCAQI